MALRMKNVNIFRVHWKIQLLGGYSQKTNIKNGGLDSLPIQGGGLGKEEEGDVF